MLLGRGGVVHEGLLFLLEAKGVGVEAVKVNGAPVVEGGRHLHPVGEYHAHQLAPYPSAALDARHHHPSSSYFLHNDTTSPQGRSRPELFSRCYVRPPPKCYRRRLHSVEMAIAMYTTSQRRVVPSRERTCRCLEGGGLLPSIPVIVTLAHLRRGGHELRVLLNARSALAIENTLFSHSSHPLPRTTSSSTSSSSSFSSSSSSGAASPVGRSPATTSRPSAAFLSSSPCGAAASSSSTGATSSAEPARKRSVK